MFHVELRRFPHVARAFNLSENDLQSRIVLPWVRGIPIVLEDRQWTTTEKTRLAIYEAPEIAPEERGLGRGWSNVTRDGTDVTTKFLDAARAQLNAGRPEAYMPELKRELVTSAQSRPLPLPAAVALVDGRQPTWRPSERLSLVERAVWELLQHGELTLLRSSAQVPAAEWEPVLLARETWNDPAAEVSLIARTPPPD